MAAALPSVRGCPCTNPDEEQFPALVFYGGLPVLKTLHCVKHILNEEECRSVGKAGVYWYDELAVVIVVKGAVQETLGVLEENKRDLWLDRADKTIKMLSELYQEKLVTEDEVKRMKGEGGDLSARVVIVQCTKPPKVVARTVNLLDKYRHIEEARWLRVLNELFTRHLLTAEECSQVARERWKWKDHLYPVLSTKPAEVVQEACQVLEKHGCRVEEKLKILNELFTRHLLTAEEYSEVARKGSWKDHLNEVLLTKPSKVVQATSQVLEKHGLLVKELKRIRGRSLGVGMGPSHFSSPWGLRTAPADYRLSRKASSKPYSGYLRASASLQNQPAFSRKPFSDVGYSGSRTESYDSGLGGSRVASRDSVCDDSSTVGTSTRSQSHLVESYQKMSMHPHAEGSSLSQTELSSEEVEEESKHQGSKVPSGPAGEGSGPPREPDSAAVKVYQVKTPRPPSSPSASSSSSMGGCPSLPSSMDNGDEGSETPSSAHPPNGTCQTALTSKKAQATSTDISQPGASTVDSGRDPVLSQKVYDRTDQLILFRTFVSRNAVTKGRAVLEGVGLLTETKDACFSSHPLDEEEAVQAGLTRWSGGQGRQPPTWEVLISAMEFAKIAQQHIEDLRKELHASLRAEGTVCTD